MNQSMIKMDHSDLKILTKRFKNQKHSFFLLQSLHGCSISECEQMLEDSTTNNYLLDSKKDPRMLLSIFDIDLSQQHLRLQLCINDGCEMALEGFMIDIIKNYELHRIYSYVFSDESLEINYLESSGFIYEATFPQHIYLDGKYHDLLVYGYLA